MITEDKGSEGGFEISFRLQKVSASSVWQLVPQQEASQLKAGPPNGLLKILGSTSKAVRMEQSTRMICVVLWVGEQFASSPSELCFISPTHHYFVGNRWNYSSV